MSKKFDILIPGNYACNLIMTGLPGLPELGKEIYSEKLALVPGGVMNTVIALRKLEINVGWRGTVGTDFFSRAMLERAEREGVDTSLMIEVKKPLRIVTVALSYPEDRALVSYRDPDPSEINLLLNEELKEVQFRCLHFGFLVVDKRMPDLLQKYREQGVKISSDCQYHEGVTLDDPLVRDILAQIDIFIPNKSEVRLMTGEETLEAGAQKLSEIVPYLVVKAGGEGSHAWHKNRHYQQPPIEIEMVDTTGAGDVFNAGFLAAYLKGHDPDTCLRWGNIAGGVATQGYGGASPAPTLEELQGHLDKSYPKDR